MICFPLSKMTPESWKNPRFLLVYTTQPFEALPIRALTEQFPNLTIVGVSSHHGIFTPDGFKRGSYAVLFENEDTPDINAKLVAFDDNDNVRKKVADCLQNMPALTSNRRQFTMNATPGCEERILEGFRDVFADSVEVYGGTAGHDRFLPAPYVFLNNNKTTNGVVICEMSSQNLQTATTMNGYLLTQKRGIITRCEGRKIYEIDHNPAPEVFNLWTDEMFSETLKYGGELPRSAARFPLGRIRENTSTFDVWLTHVYAATDDNALCVYSEIKEGAEVCLMRGSRERIFDSLKHSIDLSLAGVDRSTIRGALLTFCAGSMNLISENIEQFNQAVCDSFGDIPFLGFSSCGEQGLLTDEVCVQHGNMMLNITLVR